MPMCRFRCSHCGLEGTRIGVADRTMTSVQSEEWTQLCVFAAQARNSGEPVDLVTVNYPHLQASAKLTDTADAALTQ
jgi:hypothetical protein